MKKSEFICGICTALLLFGISAALKYLAINKANDTSQASISQEYGNKRGVTVWEPPDDLVQSAQRIINSEHFTWSWNRFQTRGIKNARYCTGRRTRICLKFNDQQATYCQVDIVRRFSPGTSVSQDSAYEYCSLVFQRQYSRWKLLPECNWGVLDQESQKLLEVSLDRDGTVDTDPRMLRPQPSHAYVCTRIGSLLRKLPKI